MYARYAQQYAGQRLHIVEADANTKTVANTAICGRNCKQGWRITINVPLANLCKNCRRFAKDVTIIDF